MVILQVSKTKYRKFSGPSKWSEIEKLYGIEVVLAATLGKNHLITTDGAGLNDGSLKETCKNGLSVVNFMDNGINYCSVYQVNLIMKKFIDSSFSITNGKVYYIEKDLNNSTLDYIDFLDSSLRKQGMPKTKAKPKGSAAEDSNKYCY